MKYALITLWIMTLAGIFLLGQHIDPCPQVQQRTYTGMKGGDVERVIIRRYPNESRWIVISPSGEHLGELDRVRPDLKLKDFSTGSASR